MREIKFRAWDEIEDKMYDNGIILYPGGAVQCLNSKKQVCKGMNHDEDLFVLMQFTGLKDENGKDIYEGDIVGNYLGRHNDTDTIIKDSNNIVTWDNEKMGFNLYSNTSYLILGNIYENPELCNES